MATHKKPGKWRPRTQAVRGGQLRTPFQETAEGLFLTSGYAYEAPEEAEARFKGADGYTYTRYGNPTTTMFEDRLAALEGAPCARATASGMAAVTRDLSCRRCEAGDHVIGAKAMFGACRYVIEEVLSRFGIASTLVEGTDPSAWQAAMRPETKMLFLETPANPDACHRRSQGRCRDRPCGGARLSSTTPSPRRRCSGRWSSAPISSSIRPPNMWTGRAAASAA